MTFNRGCNVRQDQHLAILVFKDEFLLLYLYKPLFILVVNHLSVNIVTIVDVPFPPHISQTEQRRTLFINSNLFEYCLVERIDLPYFLVVEISQIDPKKLLELCVAVGEGQSLVFLVEPDDHDARVLCIQYSLERFTLLLH